MTNASGTRRRLLLCFVGVVSVLVIGASVWRIVRWANMTKAEFYGYGQLVHDGEFEEIRLRLRRAKPVEKIQCVLALSDNPVSEGMDILNALASDDHSAVRAAIAQHLDQLPSEFAGELAAKLASDPHPTVSEMAKTYLENSGG